MKEDPPPPPGRAIARRDFEEVIRRAAELSLAEADAAEELSEDEVVRIAGELGLPAHHVRQALHERPTLQASPRWYDRWFDSPLLALGRTLPGRSDALQQRLEQYLTTYEYLQLVRRRGSDLAFIPAEDTISRLARVFARPARRFGLAHAERVLLSVQQLPEQNAHVRIEADFREERAQAARSALRVGGSVGLLAGAVLAGIVGASTTGAAELVLGAGAMITGAGGIMALSVRRQARHFRDRLDRVRRELLLLLDRAESGQSLVPPPAPWRRNLQARLFGPRH